MTHAREMSNPWGDLLPASEARDENSIGASRIPDLILGALLLMETGIPGAGTFRIGNVAMILLILLAFTRRPQRALTSMSWLPYLLVATMGWLVVVTLLGDRVGPYDWTTRAIRLALVGIFVMVLVSGRLHAPSIVRGATIGLALNAVLFVVGLAPGGGPGEELSGFLGDKNVAGLAYACVALLAFALAKSQIERWVTLIAFFGMLWLTESRTALAALALGLVWYYARPRVPAWARWVLPLPMFWALTEVERRFSHAGGFASRVGSDALRARIDTASELKWQESPWYGRGIAQAYVDVDDRTFLFHNSYLGRLVEGGWPYLIVLLFLHVVFGVALFHKAAPSTRLIGAAEAANVVVLVCATRLGEVFVTTPASLVLAMGIIGFIHARDEANKDTGPPANAGPEGQHGQIINRDLTGVDATPTTALRNGDARGSALGDPPQP